MLAPNLQHIWQIEMLLASPTRFCFNKKGVALRLKSYKIVVVIVSENVLYRIML